MAKFPIAQASNNGVLTSRGLTLALVTSAVALASTNTIDFISDLKEGKKIFKKM